MLDFSQLELTPTQLLRLCRYFGLPVPPEADFKVANVWFSGSFNQQELQALRFERPSAAVTMAYQLAQPLKSWGLLRLEPEQQASSVQTALQTETQSIPNFEPLKPEDPQYGLQSLLLKVIELLGQRSWLLWWGQDDQQYWLLGLLPVDWSWQPAYWQSANFLSLPDSVSLLSQAMLEQALTAEADLQDAQWLAGRLLLAPAAHAPRRNQLLKTLVSLPRRLRQTSQAIWETFLIEPSSLQGQLQQWQEILRVFVPAARQTHQLIEILGGPLEDTKKLADLLADHVSLPTRMHNELSGLWEQAEHWSEEHAEEEFEKIFEDPDFKPAWQLFKGHYGHLAAGALDLSRPRLAELMPELVGLCFAPHSEDPERGLHVNPKGLSYLQWQTLAWLLKQRERLWADGLWALQQVRLRLLRLAEALVERQQLEQPQDIWQLLPSELLLLEEHSRDFRQRIHQRRQQSQDWLTVWRSQQSFSQHSLRGWGLGTGLLEGQIWQPCFSPDTPPLKLPEGLDPDQTILVASQLDYGWLPCLEQVAGVLLTEGGPFDESALLLRELGKPAVVALPAAAALNEGQRVRLNAETGSVQLIEN